ncbi:Hermansky-Pudlak syndrome 1 protein [Oratosquilla oratoria]|uniref:Hermansky-Pudlak syndrome 1 protein n=1 Tax=Oratosquilla oratoria TaxID=337810 RepID=UPI003F76DB29
MLAILVFDQLNDVVYLRCDEKFVRHVHSMAVAQGLLAEAEADQMSQLDPNIVVQLFSPLVTSQRIMAAQFNNPYTSVSCMDGTTVVFKEYASYLFVGVGQESEAHLQRITSVAIRMVQLIVGPCITLLKKSSEKSRLLDSLLEAWQNLYMTEQCYLVEAVERLVVNAELSAASIKVLGSVVDKVKPAKDLTPSHAIFFVRNKLLALYSSRNAQELSASDVLFLNLLVEAGKVQALKTDEGLEEAVAEEINKDEKEEDVEIESSNSGEFFSPPNSPSTTKKQLSEGGNYVEVATSEKVKSTVLLLQTDCCNLTPHVVHYETISDGLSLVVVSEVGRTLLSAQLTTLLTTLEGLTCGRVAGQSRAVLDVCDGSLKKAIDLAKRLPKGNSADKVEKSLQQVSNRWDGVKRSGLEEWLKSGGDENLPSRVEASLSASLEAMRGAWRASCLAITTPHGDPLVQSAVELATSKMEDYWHFLEVKALRNMTLGCRSALSINKYLEEFPGLVHFLYIDRSNHQLTAPTLHIENEDSEKEDDTPTKSPQALTVARVWSMVQFARSHLARGHLSLMWKDTTFNYAYFLWFEDSGGNPIRPAVTLDESVLEKLPLPGVLCQDFYKALCLEAFPGTDPSRLHMYELLCVHLGLATSPCVLEHTRRLAATIWEVAGPAAANPAELL